MAEFAALPIFTDSLLADTGHLTDEEFGRYMRLLIVSWRTPGCLIPNDKSWIAKRLRLDPLQYDSKIKPLIEEFFTSDGNSHMQKRLRKEYEYVKKSTQRMSDLAKSRWEKEKRSCVGNAPTPTPTPTKESPLPPKGGKTGFKKDSEKGEESPPFDIRFELSDQDLEDARREAPGWDIHNLMKIYNEGTSSRGTPRNPGRAFVAWCGKYTKGKRP